MAKEAEEKEWLTPAGVPGMKTSCRDLETAYDFYRQRRGNGTTGAGTEHEKIQRSVDGERQGASRSGEVLAGVGAAEKMRRKRNNSKAE